MDEDFISACDNHEHTEHDETIEGCNEFFRLLMSQSQEHVNSKECRVDFTHKTKTDNGESSERRVIGRIVHIRGGIARVTEDNSNAKVDVLWRDTKIEHNEVNELLLSDMLKKQKHDHLLNEWLLLKWCLSKNFNMSSWGTTRWFGSIHSVPTQDKADTKHYA